MVDPKKPPGSDQQATDDEMEGLSTGKKTGEGKDIPQSEIDRQDADHADDA